MKLETRQTSRAVVLSPEGRIDQAQAADFQAAIESHLKQLPPGVRDVVLDFAAVQYIDSAGLRALLVVSRKAKRDEVRMVVSGLTSTVREVFEISRFNAVFTLFDSVEAALATPEMRA